MSELTVQNPGALRISLGSFHYLTIHSTRVGHPRLGLFQNTGVVVCGVDYVPAESLVPFLLVAADVLLKCGEHHLVAQLLEMYLHHNTAQLPKE